MTKTCQLIALAALAATATGCGSLAGSGNHREPMLPHDREVITSRKDIRTYTPEEIRKGVVKGDWSIQSAMGREARGEKAPFLKFVPGQKRVYGNNGCNTLNATYTYAPKDSTLRFGDIASTMMACPGSDITDTEINRALADTRRYTWRIEGSDYFLHFFDAAGREVMTLMHQNFDFLNGTWRVTAINDTKVNVEDMKIVIDVDEGKLHGNTGCNIINGVMDINMEEANSISFSAIGITRMACPDMNYETALVVALEEAAAARPVGPDEVLLFDSQGKQVLSLRRAPDN